MTTLIEALRAYEQADEDGVMVLVSRQACDEAADKIERLEAALDGLFAGGFIEAGARDFTEWSIELDRRLKPCRAAISLVEQE